MTNPTPHGQVPASSAVLKAIREANMQLVRTGDDAFMLVPYQQAHVQNPTENEHVAGDVSKNGAWLNMGTQQPAPAGATEEVENLRKALVYAAFALHDTPQYMLAQGITLIDGDTVRVSRDGWTVEASINPHRQPAPATQQAGEAWQASATRGQAPARKQGASHDR